MNKLIKYIRDGRSPVPKKEVTSKIMRANKGKNTQPEILLRKQLWKKEIRGYRVNWRRIPGSPDIVFTRNKLAIFVNGCFWHRCEICTPNFPKSNVEFWSQKFEKNKQRDIDKNEELASIGWKVLTIWECEILNNLSSVVMRIKNELNAIKFSHE